MRVLSLLIALTCATAQAGLPGNLNVGGQGGHLNVPLSQLALNLPLTATGTSECAGASIPGLTFSRSSSATCTKSDGTTVLLSSNQPRVSGSGLLVEGSGTNLILQSAALDNASWTADGVTVAADAVAAPDGTTTAERLTENGVTAQHRLYQGVTVASGATATVSVYLKDGPTNGRRYAFLVLNNGANSAYALADLQTGTITASGTQGTGVLSGSSITASANGAYRVTVTGSIPATTSYFLIVQLWNASTGAPGAYLGNSTANVIAWGGQIEANGFATSYIPTAGTSATRSADSASVAQPAGLTDSVGCVGATVSVPSTLVADARIIGTTGTRGFAFTATGYKFDDGNNISTATASVGGQTRRIRVSWSGTTATLSDDAGNTGTGTYDGGWLTTTLYLGSQNGSSNFLNSNISNVVFGRTPGACN